MPRKLRIARPRHATIVAYIALFSALSGSAYAAVRVSGAEILDESIESVDVKDDSLTGADVKYGALTGANIADASVKGADIANGSVSGAKVFDGTLTTADLAPGAGIGYVHMYTDETSSNATDTKDRTVNCPEDEQAIGGGGWVEDSSGQPNRVALVGSHHSQTAPWVGIPEGWTVEAAETNPGSGNWRLYVHVLCVAKPG